MVQHIGFCAPLKYLLVVLKPGFGGAELAALKPNTAAMAHAVSASELTGVIVAAAAKEGEQTGCVQSTSDICYLVTCCQSATPSK